MKKTLFKNLALLLTVPTMLLSTSCSNFDVEDNPVVPQVKSNPYTTTVTVNSSCATIFPATRASYDDFNMRLSFSEGDQLFVFGTHSEAGKFAGMLTWISGNTFSGEVTTENPYYGTGDALITQMSWALLYPNGYSTYGFLSVSGSGADAECSTNLNKAFVSGDRALGIEQLSYQTSGIYRNQYPLKSLSAIIACTITGLAANTAYNIQVNNETDAPQGSVTTNASGEAIFCVAFRPGAFIKTYTIKIDDGSVYDDIFLFQTSLVTDRIYDINVAATAIASTDN